MDEGNSQFHYGYGELKHRENKGEGLTADMVRLGKRLSRLRVMDKRHARLNEILVESGLVEAANSLEQAHMALTRGLGYAVMDVNKIRGHSTKAADYLDTLIQTYLKWDGECKRYHVSPIMCRQVIIEGYSLNETDAAHKMREGTAKKNMIAALEIFAKML